MKALILFASLFSANAYAAITSNHVCETAQGTRVSWEVRPSNELYNSINIEKNGKSVRLSPANVKADFEANGSVLEAGDSDSEVVKIDAKKLLLNLGDEQQYRGKIELRVEMKDGSMIEEDGTAVRCTVYGEG